MPHRRLGGGMPDAGAFDEAVFLGLSRRSKRDPYRLGLFAQHLEPAERGLVVLAVQAGTLLVTDRRILELRPHLEVHGAWNVKEFQGYEVRRAWERARVREVTHDVRPAVENPHVVEDSLFFGLGDCRESVLVSRGPEPTLPPEEADVLRAAILGHAK